MDSDGPEDGCGCCCGGGDFDGVDCCSCGLAGFGFLLSTRMITKITTTIIPMAPTSMTIVSGSRVVGAVVDVGGLVSVGWFVGLNVGCVVTVGAGVGVAIVLAS